jgi:hypothetical protein
VQQQVSTKTHGTDLHPAQTSERRRSHRRPAREPAAPTPAWARRALDVNLTDEQKDELLAMTPAERVDAMLAGRLTLGQQAFWSRRREAEVPMIGNELAYIARYDPEYCEAGEKQARS